MASVVFTSNTGPALKIHPYTLHYTVLPAALVLVHTDVINPSLGLFIVYLAGAVVMLWLMPLKHLQDIETGRMAATDSTYGPKWFLIAYPIAVAAVLAYNSSSVYAAGRDPGLFRMVLDGTILAMLLANALLGRRACRRIRLRAERAADEEGLCHVCAAFRSDDTDPHCPACMYLHPDRAD